MVTTRVETRFGLYPSDQARSFIDILRWRAENQPDRLAYLFITGGLDSEFPITYGELDRTARRIAARIRKVASPGDRAMLFYPSGPDFIGAFMGCMYAGVVAIPLYPPRPNRSATRLESVIEDSGARLALTQTARLTDIAALHGSLSEVHSLATDEPANRFDPEYDEGVTELGEVAYLQYTSGSTSNPKGVMVTHSNLIYNCNYMVDVFGLTEESSAVTWLPHFHDMGLIEGLLNPLFAGYPAVVLSPTQFVQRPILWLEAMSRYEGTHSGAPNFAYDLCVKKIKPEQRDQLDLSNWDVAYCGAEPVRAETMERFAAYFAPAGFQKRALYPTYGLAEATLMVSGNLKLGGPLVIDVSGADLEDGLVVKESPKAKGTRSLVGCGIALMPDMKIKVVDPGSSLERSDGVVGEIWVGGPTVAAGYWNRSAETAETFDAYLAGGSEGPFMRTGDLGFFSDGQLFIAGRLKDLIIIRGGNFYPQDIELVAEKTDASLRGGRSAAFSVEMDNEERLVIVLEVDRQHRNADTSQFQAMAAAIRQAIVEEFDVETYCVQFLRVGGVHMTSSGKVQRQSCRAEFLAGKLDVLWESKMQLAAPVNGNGVKSRLGKAELERARQGQRQRLLVTYLRESLANLLEIPLSEVGANQPLGSLGIDSLKGSELTAIIQKDLALELSSTLVWNHPTIAQIAAHIEKEMGLERNGP